MGKWLSVKISNAPVAERGTFAIVSAWSVLDVGARMSREWLNDPWIFGGLCAIGMALCCYLIGVIVGYNLGKKRLIYRLEDKDESTKWEL